MKQSDWQRAFGQPDQAFHRAFTETLEQLEEMKPYGEAFIREQLFVPQKYTNVPFPTEAYVSAMVCDDG